MKYIVEVNIPEYLEVEANSEEEAEKKASFAVDYKKREIAEIKVAKEIINFVKSNLFYPI